jgi:hypothetical protein
MDGNSLYISVYHLPLRYLVIYYSVGIFRHTQLVLYSGVLILYLATCFGHLFGRLQAILGGVYFLYYITHVLHLYVYYN